MEYLDGDCKQHQFKINSICTQENCDSYLLCDLCLNKHNKSHKYIISTSSIHNNFFENLINENKENFKNFEKTFVDKFEEKIKMIEENYQQFLDYINLIINKNKTELIQNLENIKNSYISNDVNIWNDLKIDYEKNQLKLIMDSNQSFQLEKEYEINKTFDCDKEIELTEFRKFLNLVNKVIEKQLTYDKGSLISFEEVKEKILSEFNSEMNNSLSKEFDSLKENLNKFISDFFSSFNLDNFNSLQNISNPNFFKMNKIITNRNNRFTSPLQFNNRIDTRNLGFNEVSSIKIFKPNEMDVKNLKFEKYEDVFQEKKRGWYSLDYIEEKDWMVCGYHSGEIVIFKNSDLTPIKTLRPRYKRIRKLFFSSENSSIFSAYDDGYLVVVHISDFKIFHYKLSNAQIYSMELMTTQNILIFGGTEKKIFYSHISNLDKVFDFYESSTGEIECLLYYDELDILISGFRKNSLIFFKFSEDKKLREFKFEGNDNCPMVVKKIKENFILTSGYFLNLNLFQIKDCNNIEIVYTYDLGYLHIYDFQHVSNNLYLFSTFDDGKVILFDVEKKKIINTYSDLPGVVQICKLQNFIYFTSHCENIKKVKYISIN